MYTVHYFTHSVLCTLHSTPPSLDSPQNPNSAVAVQKHVMSCVNDYQVTHSVFLNFYKNLKNFSELVLDSSHYLLVVSFSQYSIVNKLTVII